MSKKPPKNNEHPIIDQIAKRWSPRGFSDKPVEMEKLLSLFEAARWSASSFNEQPWRFVVGVKGDDHYDRLFNVLNEWNQKWADEVPVLVLTLAKKTFSHNGNANAHSWHDTGAAMASLSLQASEHDLYVHQMAGIHRHIAIEEFVSDDDFEVVAMSAIGYLGDPDSLPEDIAKQEFKPQERKPLSEIVNFAD